MSDYVFNRLNTRDFEHLIQALALGVFGPTLSVYGDGPDGAREATFNGELSLPQDSKKWNGYGVLQCKFRSRDDETQPKALSNTTWAVRELKKDLKKFADSKRALKRPDYYVFATNVILSPGESGGLEKVEAILEEAKTTLGIRDYDVWHYDKICRLLDQDASVRAAFSGFITSGDVLEALKAALDQIEKSMQPDFWEVMTLFLQSELRQDFFARLEQAGYTPDQRISLSNVFVDIIPSISSDTDSIVEQDQKGSNELTGVVEELLRVGDTILRREKEDICLDFDSQDESTRVNFDENNKSVEVNSKKENKFNEFSRGMLFQRNFFGEKEEGRFVLIGGPGQGKSTVTQFLCQLYRVSVLKDNQRLSPEAREALNAIIIQSEQCGLPLPNATRFPINIVLDELASQLEKNEVKSVFDFILKRIEHVSGKNISATDLENWFSHMPWLLILDGLDEVPSSSNRSQVLETIQHFRERILLLNSDVLIVATTRPQGYNRDFSPKSYQHYYLVPLSTSRALRYAERLASTRFQGDHDRQERTLKHLRQASREPMTARLMRSPLQVTIMATLVESIGRPPKERWRLFARYFEVFYERELRRNIELSRVLSELRTAVEVMHRRVGLELQRDSEYAGRTEARLSRTRLEEILQNYFLEEECSTDQIHTWTAQILEAALQRLVFLVALQEESVGFEVRSLQEFMAAEALVDGEDDVVRDRLKAISVAPHWRNVFLFAAGKCLSERKHIFNYIIQLCGEMNESDSTPINDLLEASLAGSGLALDLLSDDLAKQSPKLQKQLLRIALRLIEKGETDACSRLSAVYSDDYAEIYKESIRSRLVISSNQESRGAWILLKSLSKRNVNWADEIASEYWETTSINRRIVFRNLKTLSNYWLKKFFVPMIPEIEFSLFELEADRFYSSNISKFGLDTTDLPVWAKSAFGFAPRYRSSEEVAFELFDDNGVSQELYFTAKSIDSNIFNQLDGLDEMPEANLEWTILKNAVSWNKEKTTRNIALCLRKVAEVWKKQEEIVIEKSKNMGSNENRDKLVRDFKSRIDSSKRVAYDIQWPLAACIISCETSEELYQLSSAIEEGQLGETEDWKKAENRWKESGVRIFEISSNSIWPQNKNGADIGFPLSSLELRSQERLLSAVRLGEIYQVNRTASEKAIVRFWARAYHTALRGRDIGTRQDEYFISPQRMKEVMKLAGIPYIHTNIFPVDEENFIEKSEDWIELVEWIGDELDVLPVPIADRQDYWLPYAASAFTANPCRLGLLNALGMFLRWSNNPGVRVPPLMLSKASLEKRAALAQRPLLTDHEFSALLVELNQSPPTSQEEAEQVAHRIIELATRSSKMHAHYALRLLYNINDNSDSSHENFDKLPSGALLALSLWKQPLYSSNLSIKSFLERTLSELKSPLADAEVWRDLRLH